MHIPPPPKNMQMQEENLLLPPETEIGPKIVIITGCMYSGKSTNLMIQLAKTAEFNLNEQNQIGNINGDNNKGHTIVLIRHKLDEVRNHGDANGPITHTGKKPCMDGSEGYDVLTGVIGFSSIGNHKAKDILEKYDNIFIDEGQFFSGLTDLCKMALCYPKPKNIYIALLNGTYKRELFETTQQLFALATDIKYLKADCMGCKAVNQAVYSTRIDQTTVETVKIDDGSDYMSHCPKCYKKFNPIHY